MSKNSYGLTVLRSYGLTVLTNWKENLYLLTLLAVIIALPTSIALLSGLAFALPVIWIITGDYKEKWNRLLHNRNALLIMSIPFLYLIALFFTHNFSVGFQELNKSLYWFIFAFFISSSPPISHKNTCRLIGAYILAVSIAAGVALKKLLFTDTVQFSDFRAVTWVDHIPFSYQIAFTIWLIFYFIIYEKFSWIKKTLLLLLMVFLFTTLLSLKSFNAYIYFGVMSLSALCIIIWKTKKRLLKITFSGVTILLILFPVFYIYHCVQKFYDTTEYNSDEIELYTANGNKYEHDFNDKTKENGNYVYLFICTEELIPLWNEHSQKQYDSKTSAGYPFYSVLIRYMTSKGLKKDAKGFAQLSQKDIESIENEFTNYIYVDNKLAVYPRIYETIWEMDQYFITKNPNRKSLPERVEQAILALDIIKKHVWFGIGLGNNAGAYDEVILETGSKLSHQEQGWTHNQYFNYLIRFGIIGTLYILGVLVYVFIKGRKNNSFLLTLFFVSMLAANFGEANWETFVGINFFAFFFCFFMWATPKEIIRNKTIIAAESP